MLNEHNTFQLPHVHTCHVEISITLRGVGEGGGGRGAGRPSTFQEGGA